MTPERIAELRALANRLGEILPKTTLAELLDAVEAVTRERDELARMCEQKTDTDRRFDAMLDSVEDVAKRWDGEWRTRHQQTVERAERAEAALEATKKQLETERKQRGEKKAARRIEAGLEEQRRNWQKLERQRDIYKQSTNELRAALRQAEATTMDAVLEATNSADTHARECLAALQSTVAALDVAREALESAAHSLERLDGTSTGEAILERVREALSKLPTRSAGAT